MHLEVLFRTTRKFVLLPILCFSIYLTIIYSDDFWMKMIGSSYLAVSLILLISALISIFFAMRAYDEEKPKQNNKQIYFVFVLINFIDSISLIFLTRDIKKMECIYWIKYFVQANKQTFFVNCFNQIYFSSSSVDYFVHSRIISVHDALICIVVITFILFFFFTFLFKRLLKLKLKLKFAKQGKNQSPRQEDIQPLVNNRQDHREDDNAININANNIPKNENTSNKGAPSKTPPKNGNSPKVPQNDSNPIKNIPDQKQQQPSKDSIQLQNSDAGRNNEEEGEYYYYSDEEEEEIQ